MTIEQMIRAQLRWVRVGVISWLIVLAIVATVYVRFQMISASAVDANPRAALCQSYWNAGRACPH